jgi:hypothetical protein
MERKRDFSWLKKNWRVLTLCGGCVFAGFLVGMLIFGSPWHLPPAWGDIPTWIIAIATLGLLIGAIITAVYAARAFGTQTEEVGLLIEERKREVDERRKAQAAQIFTGAPRPAEFGTVPYARNASDSPIYDAQFWYSDLPDPDDLGMIPPGEEISGSGRVIYSSAENAISDLILTFRDAAGFQWIRMPDGALSEQSRPTARESVQAAREPSLPTGYERLDDEITGSVADAIVVYPRSHGELRMPGEFSVSGKLGVKENRQPEHEVTVISDDGSTQGVYTRWRRIGPPERFTAVYDVWNYRDSRVLARITLTGQADR